MMSRHSNPYMSIASLLNEGEGFSVDFMSKNCSASTDNDRSSAPPNPTDVPPELRCPACKQIFDTPVFLPCSHTFCKFCAANLIESAEPLLQERSRFLCPTCRNIIKYGAEGIESLPKNINIEQAVERFKNESKLRFPACERHLEFHMEKIMWCEVCEINLCPLCSEDQRHKDHKVAPITVLKKFKAVRSRLRSTTEALRGKIEKIGSNILQTECVVTGINDRGKEMKKKVDAECDAMIAQVERRRRRMYADIDAVVGRKKAKRQKEIRGLRIQFNEARQLLREIEVVLHTDGPTDFLKKLDDVGLSSKVDEINELIEA